MQIIHHITMDLARGLPPLPLDAVQGDGNTRKILLTLLEDGKTWNVPEGVTAAVAFRKADGKKGLYDTLPHGAKAVTFEGNTVTALLAPQVLTCPGEVSAAVVFYNSALDQLATFPFAIRVKANPAAGKEISNDYYRYSTMEQVSEAVEAALASLEAEKQEFLSKAEEALQVVHNTATEDAPAIVCEAAGESVTVTDAAERPLKGLSLYGKTVQNGMPTPESPVPLVSAGASGSIGVTVTDGSQANAQTLTASTLGGLCGVPVSSGGNYTDENGQAWICDYKDYARGVYVQRIGVVVFDGSDDENWALSGNPNALVSISLNNKSGDYEGLCTHYTHAMVTSGNDAVGYSLTASYNLRIRPTDHQTLTLENWKARLVESPITVMYAFKTPIETPLSAVELAAYAALHTNKPNTTVFNDSGAGLGIAYVADTKTYIDQKLAAISAAMLNA